MNKRLRIATFNVENLDDHPGQKPDLKTRISILRPQIERLRADVLCLQEVNAQRVRGSKRRELSALDALLAQTEYQTYERAVTVGSRGSPLDVHNLVILSRFPIIETRQYLNDLVEAPRFHVLSASPPASEPQNVAWDRPMLHAQLDIGFAAPLDVLNLHLRAQLAAYVPGQKSEPFVWKSIAGWAEGYYLAVMKRSGQALEARLAVENCFAGADDALVCVLGDFNAGLDEMPMKLLIGAEEDTGSGDLAGHSLIPVELSLPADLRYSVIHHGRKQMLDHILASRSLMSRFSLLEVHNEALGDELVSYTDVTDSPSSYHAPVVAEFSFPD
jgi:endonuclease/exonuclease/phosphatase family metal-dependent hydrolase